ncbi:hypothetical protein GT037_002645 [Alternaria burnsii]|uniref:Uncharacterized protein n=1 Tax=Alternaria burnsii TaxID=1187904 RepID=A0A8H7B9D4_9PLEO|nr:uncharacterized protein GT037_002645 [Alternaria burnsii]KAF7678897.1 hypothetical protein GT037_002645 [Alternaria burnsii]
MFQTRLGNCLKVYRAQHSLGFGKLSTHFSLDKGLYWLSCCSAQSLESELDIIH